MSKVSVIISTCNRARWLSEAVESVLGQTCPIFELIVVDDGSTDNTKEICSRYSAVKYIFQVNQGNAVARNTGLRLSKGEYLVFLDDDDRLLPDAVRLGLSSFETRPEAALVFGRYKVIDSRGASLPGGGQIGDGDKPLPAASYETLLACEHFMPPACYLVRHDLLNQSGETFNPDIICSDFDLWLRVARVHPIHFHGHLVCEYRRHESNTMSNHARVMVDALYVQSLQLPYVKQSGNKGYELAYERGWNYLVNLFGPPLPYQFIGCLKRRRWRDALNVMRAMLKHYPRGLLSLPSILIDRIADKFRQGGS